MRITVDPARFTGLPLLTRQAAEGDYVVLADGLRAGRIMRQPRAFGRSTWLRSVTGPALVQAGLASSREAETLDEARAAFRAAFDRWHEWATVHPGEVHWLE